MKYLQGKGYQVHPINPGHAGKKIWGRLTYASLADVPGPIDMLDIFRNSEAAGKLVDEAIRLKDEKGIKIITGRGLDRFMFLSAADLTDQSMVY